LRKAWSMWTLFNSEDGRTPDDENRLHRRHLHGIDEPSDAELLFLRKATRPQESSPNLSDVRMERVTSIRAAIANGCYNVSSADLAQKLMDYMLGPIQ
jgi:flagellar biosynthesis anti-sigma factor FlgM